MNDIITNIFGNISDFVTDIKEFFISYFDFFKYIISFFPSPFKEIIISVLTITIVIIVVKVIDLIK